MFNQKKEVSVIGQGFVGVPMSVLIANKTNYFVNGIEKNNNVGKKIKKKLDSGLLPFNSDDKELKNKFKNCINKNYKIFLDIDRIKNSEIILVSVGFDFSKKNGIMNLKKLFISISKKIKKKTLVMIETTLPPGTCEKIIIPLMSKELRKRKININDIYFSYSYERVTPGKEYYNSISNFHRVYAGLNNQSAKICSKFLKKIINKNFSLHRLANLRDCEASKVFENSYRATNIALIDEWTKFSIENSIDIKSILKAIRYRKTHNNIMNPGLGVGGYCLTKDPSFLKFSSNKIFSNKLSFPMLNNTVLVNRKMVNTSINFIKKKISKLFNKKILLVGISYKEDVDDLRYSPSVDLYKKLLKVSKFIDIYDPYYNSNESNKLNFVDNLNFQNYDLTLFCVGHKKIKNINLYKLHPKCIYFDLNNIFNDVNYKKLKNNKIILHELARPV